MQDAQIPDMAHGVSCHSAPEIKKAAYEQIWREIDSMEASIRALKSRHNSLSISARLPPEILSEIFDWTAEMLRNKSSRWIKASFVCSHWRRVALECPKLWRRISCTSPERLRALLPRTGVVPLEIYFSIVTKKSAVGILQMLQEMHRVRELRLGSDARQNMGLVLPRLTQPAPLLETFSVVSSASYDFSQLPGNLFAGHAPQLRTLELVHCIVPKTFPLLTGVTSLKLRGTGQVPHRISLDGLMLMLESLLNIQVLELHNAHYSMSVGPHGSAPPERTVHLPNLRHLDIGYNTSTCVALLSCLKYPITTTQKIKIRTIYRKRLDFLRDLGVILAPRIRPIACVEVCKVPTQFGSQKFAFKGWGRAGTRSQLPTDVPHIDIQLLSDRSFLEPLRAVWQALPMAGLESLFIEGDISEDAGLCDFGNLSSLKTVYVEDAVLKFLRALKQGLPDCGLENNNAFPFSQKLKGPGRLSFQALRTLVLGGQYIDYSSRMGIREATELKRCFRERRKRGAPLRELYISKSLLQKGMEGEITDILHTIVKEVHWGLHDRGIEGASRGIEGILEPEDDLDIRDEQDSSESEDTEDFSSQYGSFDDYATEGDESDDDG